MPTCDACPCAISHLPPVTVTTITAGGPSLGYLRRVMACTSPRVSGRSRSKTYGKGYDSSVMHHMSNFPNKASLRESCGAEEPIVNYLHVILCHIATHFSGKSSRSALVSSLALYHQGFLPDLLVPEDATGFIRIVTLSQELQRRTPYPHHCLPTRRSRRREDRQAWRVVHNRHRDRVCL